MMFNGWRITRTGIVFILGTIVLIGLVVGGIWLVRERGEQARRQEAVKIAEQNLEDQSQAPTETKPETNDETVSGSASDEAETKPATTATASNSNTLPETGPGDIAQVIVVGILSLAVGYYLTSRRAARAL